MTYVDKTVGHLDKQDCEQLKKKLDEQLTKLAEAEQTKMHSEPMKEYPAYEVWVRAIQLVDGIKPVDYLLNRVVMNKGRANTISTIGGTITVEETATGSEFVHGFKGEYNFHYEILNYKGKVSATAYPIRNESKIDNVFIEIVPTVAYLPSIL